MYAYEDRALLRGRRTACVAGSSVVRTVVLCFSYTCCTWYVVCRCSYRLRVDVKNGRCGYFLGSCYRWLCSPYQAFMPHENRQHNVVYRSACAHWFGVVLFFAGPMISTGGAAGEQAPRRFLAAVG